MEGFKQLWEHMQSMDRTSEKIAYGAGVAAGTVGGVAGVVCGTKMAFDWLIDRYDELETRSIERFLKLSLTDYAENRCKQEGQKQRGFGRIKEHSHRT